MFPILIKGLSPDRSQILKPSISLYILSQILTNMKTKEIIEPIFIRIFFPYLESGSFEGNYPIDCIDYNYDWTRPEFCKTMNIYECIQIFNYSHIE